MKKPFNMEEPIMAEPVRIAVVTAVFNTGGSLKTCMDSVRSNGADAHWLIDNCSTDEVTRRLLSEPGDARVLSEPDNGIYDAMNKGARLADGDVIAWLNADDHYLPGTLDAVRQAFANHPEAGIVHGNIRVTGRRIVPPGGLSSFHGARIYHPACFIRKSVWESLGGYDTQYRICADLDLFIRAKHSGVKFHYLDRELTVFALGGISTKRRKEAAAEVVQVLRRNGFSRLFVLGFRLATTLRAFAARLLRRG